MTLFSGFINFIKDTYYLFERWGSVHVRPILDFLHPTFDNIFYVLLLAATIISLVYIFFSVKSIIKNYSYKEKNFDVSRAPSVTIQIPTRNEIIALRCARKCLSFDYPKEKYEILIGDDSNDVKISNEIDSFVSKHKDMVKVIRRDENIGFKPGNLNNMLKYSKGEVLVIFDSDFVPEKDFLKRIITPFIYDRNVAAVQAKWSFLNGSQNIVTVLASTIQQIVHYIFLPIMGKSEAAFICGSAEAVRRSYLEEYGGWRAGSLTEDIDYSLRMHSQNKKIVYLSELKCKNELPSTLKDLSKQQMRWAYGVVSAYKHHAINILFSKLSFKSKSISFIMAFGYLTPIFILLLTSFGILSFITATPAPLDIPKFSIETIRNIILTAGLISASLVALLKSKEIRFFPKMLGAAFSVGFVITYYVNKGIFKALFNMPMQWYLLKKSQDYKTD
jgi:cellulose synthase/poly-beta-1,6-N-acetylglucosamine synthase-like glycosyltransferase